jgi:hypothetical protein
VRSYGDGGTHGFGGGRGGTYGKEGVRTTLAFAKLRVRPCGWSLSVPMYLNEYTYI